MGLTGTIETLTVSSMSICSEDSESHTLKKNWEPTDPKMKEASDKIVEKSHSISSLGRNCEKMQMKKPTILLPEPVMLFSPRPASELDDAATKLQKVYKSYRTRRNLADCAVVVEELWWNALESVDLKRKSVLFFNNEKHETAVSKWARARTRAAKLGKGLCKDEKAQKLALQHWLEAIDPRHRYGHNLQFYYDLWTDCKSSQPFFYWLDVGEGKDTNVKKCPRPELQRQCIQYLGPKERESYEVIVEDGKLVYKKTGLLVETIEGSKCIFVLSTSRSLYVGQKKKGTFQHSSFLSGGAATAAGRIVAHGGVLEAIWPYSGHYLPTEDNFKEFISFLKENHVDLTHVKMCAVDDDKTYQNEESSKPEENHTLITTITIEETPAEEQAPVFNLAKRLSCKWASGLSPRIGCMRDYPADLQIQAFEKVNQSPRVTLGRDGSYAPIHSPRPSPNIKVSPRLAFMGLPSPRVLPISK